MNSRSTKIFAIFFLTAVCVFLWSLWKRIIHIDDVWLGEYSYFFNQLGYVKSEAMRGFYGAENKLYVYHKLFTIEGAWVVQWFGFKPYALKSLSLLYLCLSFIPLNLIYKKYSDSRQSTLLLLALYISFFHTMNLGFTFRPEMHLVLWSLLIFLFLDKYIEKSKFEDLALAGFFAGVSIATHLNGNTLALTGVLFLWFFRRWWAGFIFGAIGSWGLFFYFFFDARSIEELKLSYLQLTQWRDVAT
ncbi:MAG TPA: glycosyltransferase family 39 protein, partial [Bdellovibrio sp.]|nr:glycosyltransferase family 39 protein [Bdellovibrio sp.]